MIDRLLKKYKELPIAFKMTLWLFVCMCIQKGISLLTVPIFARIMSTEQYGVFNTFLSWETVFEIFISFRLYAGVFDKGMNKFKDSRDEYALSMQYTSTLFALVTSLIYVLFHNQINRFTGLSNLLTIGLIIELLMSAPMKFWSVKKRYEFDYKPIVIATLGLAFLNPIIGIIAVFSSDDKGIARIMSLILVQIGYGAFFYVYNLFKGKVKYNVSFAKYAVKFNAPLIPHYLSEYILNSSDRIMIQKIVGYSYVALYSVAYNVGMVLTIIVSSINQALVPWLYQELDKKNFKIICSVVTKIGYLVLLPLFVFSVMAPEVILILGGKVYSEAVYVIPPVCASVFLIYWYTLCANVEFYYDKNKFTMFISLLGAITNISLNYFFIKWFGYIAAGYTTLVSYMVYGIGHLVFMEHIFNKAEHMHLFNFKAYFLQLLVVVLFCVVCNFLYSFVLLRFALLVLLFIIILACRNKIASIIRSIKK